MFSQPQEVTPGAPKLRSLTRAAARKPHHRHHHCRCNLNQLQMLRSELRGSNTTRTLTSWTGRRWCVFAATLPVYRQPFPDWLAQNNKYLRGGSRPANEGGRSLIHSRWAATVHLIVCTSPGDFVVASPCCCAKITLHTGTRVFSSTSSSFFLLFWRLRPLHEQTGQKAAGSADPGGAAGPESEALSRTFQELSHQGQGGDGWGGGGRRRSSTHLTHREGGAHKKRGLRPIRDPDHRPSWNSVTPP